MCVPCIFGNKTRSFNFSTSLKKALNLVKNYRTLWSSFVTWISYSVKKLKIKRPSSKRLNVETSWYQFISALKCLSTKCQRKKTSALVLVSYSEIQSNTDSQFVLNHEDEEKKVEEDKEVEEKKETEDMEKVKKNKETEMR